MDDSLERDQLNLWEKLNRLYGDESGQETKPDVAEVSGDPEADSGPQSGAGEGAVTGDREELGSEALEDVELAPDLQEQPAVPGQTNEVCADCRYDCNQPAGEFVISRCKLANESQPENSSATVNRVAASAGSMGIEKINETCRRCRRSCKQRTTKLNKMLCLGFVPIEAGRSEHD
jgi:hypothetical protein